MTQISQRRLGAGPQVSAIGLGGNNFGRQGSATHDQAGTTAVLDAAVEAGITLVDTAELYGKGDSEQLIGGWLKGRNRDDILIATKFGHSAGGAPGSEAWGAPGSADYIRRACDASLTRLGIETIDLYQQHTPDPSTDIEETLAALDELVTAGKVRFIGHSNFDAAQMKAADDAARAAGQTAFVSAQNLYSLLERDIEQADLPAMNELGIGLLPYFPLASGLLTGKYTRDNRPEGSRLAHRDDLMEAVDWDRLEAYRQLCDQAGLSMLEVSMAWLLTREGVSSVIAGATTAEQVKANAAAGAVSLDADLADQVTALFA